MSPLLDLQRQLRRLGKLRMGELVATENGKTRPAKLATWRVTSPSREIVDALAVEYGGEVAPWASPDGDQWEVVTNADALDVVIPAGENAFSQWNELWGGGGCQRRCDGEKEYQSGKACLCPMDPETRRTEAQKGKACKPTTRLTVIVPAAPDLGCFMVESHGYYAAVELAGTFDVLRAAAPAGALMRARLRIDQRHKVANGKTTRYAVPILETPGLSFGALQRGEGRALPATSVPGLAAGGEARALAPAPAPAPTPHRDVPALPPPELPPPAPRVDAPQATVAPVVGATTIDKGKALKDGDGARAINARVANLDDEHQEILLATLRARNITLDDDGADKVLTVVENQQTAAHLNRQRKTNAAMGAIGITDDDARHQFVADATAGATNSTGHLTDEQCKLVVEAATS